MSSLTQIAVPFHSAELYLVEYKGQPYTPMKPIVEGMGLAWQPQHRKLIERFKSTIIEMVIVANDGKERLMTCLPVRKLAAWLYSISPHKVKPEIHDTVVMYQNECDDVLWDYWTKGQAVNPRPKRTTKDKRTALHEAFALLMTKSKYLNFRDCYKIIHQAFDVNHLDEIPEEKLPEAIAYIHQLMGGKSANPHFENHAHNTALHMLWVAAWWDCYGDSLKMLNPDMAAKINDHFDDGAISASMLLGEKTKALNERIQQDLPFRLSFHDRVSFFRKKYS